MNHVILLLKIYKAFKEFRIKCKLSSLLHVILPFMKAVNRVTTIIPSCSKCYKGKKQVTERRLTLDMGVREGFSQILNQDLKKES